jgi:hypothetical protein
MAKVSIEVPKDKMQSFLQAVINLGIDTKAVLTKRYRKALTSEAMKKFSTSFGRFGWEYFSNELEYE